MIAEAVQSIVEAEELSEKEIENAEKSRLEVISEAETEADAVRKNGAAEIKKLVSLSNAEAAETADKRASERVAEGKKEVDAEMEKYAANVKKAVKTITEKII